jgi:hypothetical protein
MTDVLNYMLDGIGGPALILAGFSAFLGAVWKNRIHLKEKHGYEAQIKKMEQSHAKETQFLEHELQVQRHAVQLGHSKLIEKRAEMIGEIYRLLVDLHDSIFDIIRPDFFGRSKPPKEEIYDWSLRKFDVLVKDFEKNKIYFSKDVSERISKFYVSAAQALNEARKSVEAGEHLGKGLTPNLQKIFDKVNNEMWSAREAVEQDFREILQAEKV